MQVTFYDHVFGGSELAICHTWGRLIKHTSKEIVLRVWETEDEDADSDAHETVCIALGAVKRITYFTASPKKDRK